MGNSVYTTTGHLSPYDEDSFVIRVETDNLKMLNKSFKKHTDMRNDIELLNTEYLLKETDVYPERFIIIDIDPIVFDESKDVYYYTLYCYGDDKLNSKMDMLKRFFEKFYTVIKK